MVCGIRNFRVLYGPLPLIVCQAHFKIVQAAITFSIVIIITVTLVRFTFICVWKSLKPIKDDFCARIVSNQAFMMCALHTWCWPTINLDVSNFRLFRSKILNRDFRKCVGSFGGADGRVSKVTVETR